MVWISVGPRGRSTAGAFLVPLVTNQDTPVNRAYKKKKISALSAKLQVARIGSPLVPQWFTTTPASPPQKKMWSGASAAGLRVMLLMWGIHSLNVRIKNPTTQGDGSELENLL